MPLYVLPPCRQAALVPGRDAFWRPSATEMDDGTAEFATVRVRFAKSITRLPHSGSPAAESHLMLLHPRAGYVLAL